MKLINKHEVVAEIEKRISKYINKYNEYVYYEVWADAKKLEQKIIELKELLSFINNLDVLEIDYPC